MWQLCNISFSLFLLHGLIVAVMEAHVLDMPIYCRRSFATNRVHRNHGLHRYCMNVRDDHDAVDVPPPRT